MIRWPWPRLRCSWVSWSWGGSVPRKGGPSMFSIRTVLVPMDFSACALAALDHAVDLARPQRGPILLLHVVPPTASGLAEAEPIGPEVVSRFEDRLRQLADRLKAERLNAEPLVLIGNIEDEILTMARRRGGDLILVRAHGHSG